MRHLAGPHRLQDRRPVRGQLKRIAIAACDHDSAAVPLLVSHGRREEIVGLVAGSFAQAKPQAATNCGSISSWSISSASKCRPGSLDATRAGCHRASRGPSQSAWAVRASDCLPDRVGAAAFAAALCARRLTPTPAYGSDSGRYLRNVVEPDLDPITDVMTQGMSPVRKPRTPGSVVPRITRRAAAGARPAPHSRPCQAVSPSWRRPPRADRAA